MKGLSKHIKVECYFISEKSNLISVGYVKTEEQLRDIFIIHEMNSVLDTFVTS